MFLKSLELIGFKSFAQKTNLDFPSGITAVVGPNGSGKSNVIDAIRWLLGERDAKNLRSGKAEDLIFNGTPKRARAGMAQASLTFDNSTGYFPVDFKEVVITRKLNRDGESEYLLNKSEIKLKELIEFLNRARLGTKGLIIVNQGNSDIFVKATPEARRIMIEEILGLREYQTKRLDSERKLKNTHENLEKVSAMIQEVIPRLRTLKRQTEKWAKRTTIEENLRDLEDAFFIKKLREIKESKDNLLPKEKVVANSLSEKDKELELLQKELEKIEASFREPDEIKTIRLEKQKLLNERSEFERELGKFEAKLEFLENTKEETGSFEAEKLVDLIKEIKSALSDGINMELEKLRSLSVSLISKIDNFLNGDKTEVNKNNLEIIASLKENRDVLLKKFNNLEKQLEELEIKEGELTSGLEQFNEKFKKAVSLVEEKRREIRMLEEERNKLLFEAERIKIKTEEIEHQIFQAGRRKDEFNLEADKELSIDFSEAERKIFKLRGELASIGEVDETMIKETEEVEKHYNFLVAQSGDLEKAAEDLKNLITELSQKIVVEFNSSLKSINEEFNKFFHLMFKGGSAKLKIQPLKPKMIENGEGELIEEKPVEENAFDAGGIEIELALPQKRLSSLEMLSGGEKSLVSIAALFALISVSPPPFLVLDEIDAALDENNSQRLANLVKESAKNTQFIIVTHNRAIMESADVLYGVTVADDGASKLLSLKLE